MAVQKLVLIKRSGKKIKHGWLHRFISLKCKPTRNHSSTVSADQLTQYHPQIHLETVNANTMNSDLWRIILLY